MNKVLLAGFESLPVAGDNSPTGRTAYWKLWTCVMSYDDSMFWRARAEQMRALAETMEAGISKQVMRRIAEDYERFAESIEQRPNRFLPPEEVVPAEVRKFGHRTRSAGAPPPLVPDYDLPDFLKRAHATAEEPSDDNGS